jgi:hypothetical protein
MNFVAIKHVDNVLLLMLLMMVIIVNLWEMNFVLSSSMLNMLDGNDDDNNDKELGKDEFCCYQGC